VDGSAAIAPPADGIGYELWRRAVDGGGHTTLYAVVHPRAKTRLRVVCFAHTRRLDVWCREAKAPEAVVGRFFVRDPYRPLGELWLRGRLARCVPVVEPFGARRACVVSDEEGVRLMPRSHAPAQPTGDLLQAGPMLVEGGAIAFDPDADVEGFSTGSAQFDSDITDGRHPRAALGLSERSIFVVACDGRRSGIDAGLSMLELAEVMLELGSRAAINLDGGGSTTLVHRGHLLNRPYSTQDQPAPQSRRVVTALVLDRVA
jgi:phosphodiester glycosidase